MLHLNGRSILLGGFHDHWSRADSHNPAVFLAALNHYHYDFVTLMCGPEYDAPLLRASQVLSRHTRLYPGREALFGWGHLVTVNPRSAPPHSDSSDYRDVLRKLKEDCDLVILAHPSYLAWESLVETGEMERLIDEGLLDGVQLGMDQIEQPDSRDGQLWEWVRRRDLEGRPVPVAGGWDLHIIRQFPGIPPVLYGSDFAPDGHFEVPCSNRTLIFANENTLPAIVRAVKAGETVVEHLPSARLYGRSDLVRFLEENGYREKIAKLDAQREETRLDLLEPLISGRAAKVAISQSGTLRLPVSMEAAHETQVSAGELTWPSIPALLERDEEYLPIVWTSSEGREKIWAVKSLHSIQLEVVPKLDAGEWKVEIVAKVPFTGQIEIMIEGQPAPIRERIDERAELRLREAPEAGAILRYELAATNDAGFQRKFSGHLTFLEAKRFWGDWTCIPSFGVDQSRFASMHCWSCRPWPGQDVYSALLQIGWTPEALHFRASVTDAIHYQPYEGHYLYNGDSLQLAIDPMHRRRPVLGHVHVFNLGKKASGAELYRMWAPEEEKTAGFTPASADVSLGDEYLKVMPWEKGLVYEMRLPWAELAPVAPGAGSRMGIYYIMFNNNGSGTVDTLHWPVPIVGMWMRPNLWGTVVLSDRPDQSDGNSGS